MRIHPILKGIFLAAFAGCCWGSMGVASQYLFTDCGFTPDDLTPLRMLGAGVVMLLFVAYSQRRNPLNDLKNLKNLRDLLIYGITVLLIQYCFFVAINVSNAGTAAIMVGTGPLFIMGFYVVCKNRKPTYRELVCVCLAIIGIALIITKGDFRSLNFSWQGAFWGILASAFGAVSTIQPRAAMNRIGVISVVGWGMLLGGLVSCLFISPIPKASVWNLTTIACCLYIVVFGTVISFCCYLKSTDYVIPSVSAILASFEPLSSVFLSVVILGTTFNSWEILGGLAIISNMIILSWPSGRSIAAIPPSSENAQN
ncbi:MAG: DMT family transporter [Burkholderiales bacterium]|nr:DMT family transporter [Burkholderiales bacterium]